jgi:hypothetical protein
MQRSLLAVVGLLAASCEGWALSRRTVVSGLAAAAIAPPPLVHAAEPEAQPVKELTEEERLERKREVRCSLKGVHLRASC